MKSREIQLSICITTFNMERFIQRSLDSVLAQKVNFNYEIIISDDCSTDQTINILKKYKILFGDKIVILNSTINTGVVSNCKRAIKAAKGNYIALLDADDYWSDENKLQKQFNILKTNDSIGFVYTNFMYINEEGKIGGVGIQENFIAPQKGDFIPYLISPYISPSCICFRRKIFNSQMFNSISDPNYASQEYTLFLNFTSREYGFYMNEVTMIYTVRSESLSRKKFYKDKIRTSYASFNAANEFIKTHPIPIKVNKKRLFNFHLKILLIAWESKNHKIIKKFSAKLPLYQFLKYNPKAAYIYFASKSKLLYKLFHPWVLRKREPGK